MRSSAGVSWRSKPAPVTSPFAFLASHSTAGISAVLPRLPRSTSLVMTMEVSFDSNKSPAALLFLAITTLKHDQVKMMLDSGTNPNLSFENLPNIPRLGPTIAEDSVGHKVVRGRDGTFPITPLHLAMLTCYHHPDLSEEEGNFALSNVIALIDSGADRFARCSGGIVLTNFGQMLWCIFGSENETSTTPFGLFTHLAGNLDNRRRYEMQREMLAMINMALFKPQSRTPEYPKHPSVSVLQSVAATYENLLLLSPEFSDIKFLCSDGQTIYAHRNILSAALAYFAAAFKGPWSENNTGVWKTSHCSKVMVAMLTLVYCGKTSPEFLELNPIHLLRVASEFDLAPLKTLAEDRCVGDIWVENIKEMLQAAGLYNNPLLKHACFDFVKRNAVVVLMHPSVMSLATEDPMLWQELGQAVGSSVMMTSGQNASRKKMRLTS